MSAEPTDQKKDLKTTDIAACAIFIFANAPSGGRKGQSFIKDKVREIKVEVGNELHHIHIYDIAEGQSGEKRGFEALRNFIQNYDIPITVACAGGDGTMMWCLEECEQHFINFNRVVFAIIPCGTGNDLAHSTGFETNLFGNLFNRTLENMRHLIQMLSNARVSPHDLWKIQVECSPEGSIGKADVSVAKSNQIFSTNSVEKNATYIMSNYFSIGLDARAGRGFDKRRTKWAAVNKLIYGFEGLKRICCGSVGAAKRCISTMEDNTLDGKNIIFSTAKQTNVPRVSRFVTLLALNVNSYAGGCYPWSSSTVLAVGNRTKARTPAERELLSTRQELGDGKLEWMVFSRMSHVGLEQVISGNAKRLHQGQGPWTINTAASQSGPTYFQVDGEFFKAFHVLHFRVSHYRTIKLLTRLGTGLSNAQV